MIEGDDEDLKKQKRKAALEKEDWQGLTVLHFLPTPSMLELDSLKQEMEELVKLHTAEDRSALHSQALSGNTAMVDAFLQRDDEELLRKARFDDGASPLHSAARSGN